ncbi:hypothetical protein BHECKSOX_2411 [Bathymodiolus heckerae thiotrophic gill symbiont]|nr:hypothetical protein BHECKSOX_2411 [Bathymodiolus heckerae thiotrophic gill symbiont]
MSNFHSPKLHKEPDFLSAMLLILNKDDSASMEHPVFSLSTKPDHRMLLYEYNGNTIKR